MWLCRKVSAYCQHPLNQQAFRAKLATNSVTDSSWWRIHCQVCVSVVLVSTPGCNVLAERAQFEEIRAGPDCDPGVANSGGGKHSGGGAQYVSLQWRPAPLLMLALNWHCLSVDALPHHNTELLPLTPPKHLAQSVCRSLFYHTRNFLITSHFMFNPPCAEDCGYHPAGRHTTT